MLWIDPSCYQAGICLQDSPSCGDWWRPLLARKVIASMRRVGSWVVDQAQEKRAGRRQLRHRRDVIGRGWGWPQVEKGFETARFNHSRTSPDFRRLNPCSDGLLSSFRFSRFLRSGTVPSARVLGRNAVPSEAREMAPREFVATRSQWPSLRSR